VLPPGDAAKLNYSSIYPHNIMAYVTFEKKKHQLSSQDYCKILDVI